MTRFALPLALGACTDPSAPEAAAATGVEDTEHSVAVEPPAVVAEAFAAAYPSATRLEWEMEGGGYEASFTKGGADMSVVFLADGTPGATEMTIAAANLPPAVTEALARDHAGQAVSEAARIEDGEQTTYEAEVTVDGAATDYIFSEDGTLLSTETD